MRVLRAGWRVLLWLCLLPVALALIWVVCNRIDERPSPLAVQWYAPIVHTTPDADNAWLAMLGIGAAGDATPIAEGAARVAASQAIEVGDPGTDGSPYIEALPFAWDTSSAGKIDPPCADRDCLVWAYDHRAALRQLAAANAVRQQRYVALLTMRRFEETVVPDLRSPTPALVADNALYLDLILRDLADPAERSAAAQRLQRAATFWRGVDEQAQTFAMKLLAGRMLSGYVRAADALLEHIGAPNDPALREALDVVLEAPGKAQGDTELASRNEALAFRATMAGMHGPIDTARRCVSTAQSPCWEQTLIALAYQPQATLNLRARFSDRMAESHRWSSLQSSEAAENLSALFNAEMPLGDARQSLRALAYNFSGRVMVSISIPEMPEIPLGHDREALRRMVSLKYSALRQGIAARGMADFLKGQPEARRNPYDGAAFHWDDLFGEIQYAPKSKYWKRDGLSVAYSTGQDIQIEPCDRVIQVNIGGKATPKSNSFLLRMGSCGFGTRFAISDAEVVEQAIQDRSETDPLGLGFDHPVRPAAITLASRGDSVDLRFFLDDGGELLTYEARGVRIGGDLAHLDLLGRASGPALTVTLDLPSPMDAPAYSIRARNTSAQSLARRLAMGDPDSLRGVELLSAMPTAFSFDATYIGDAWESLGGDALHLAMNADGSKFWFEPKEKAKR